MHHNLQSLIDANLRSERPGAVFLYDGVHVPHFALLAVGEDQEAGRGVLVLLFLVLLNLEVRTPDQPKKVKKSCSLCETFLN